MVTQYDPFRHHRKSIRKRGWDYRTPGYYFITICTHQRQLIFDDAAIAELVRTIWNLIPATGWGNHIKLDQFVVMPNHIHCIILITQFYDHTQTEPEPQTEFKSPPKGSVGYVMKNFKQQVSQKVNQLRKSTGSPVWQRGYYDRIVRNQIELDAIRYYIEQNPIRWAEDRDNIDEHIRKMTYHR